MATQWYKYTTSTSNTDMIWYTLMQKYTWTSHGYIICSIKVNIMLMIKPEWICLSYNWRLDQSLHTTAEVCFVFFQILFICASVLHSYNCNYVFKLLLCCSTGVRAWKSGVYVLIRWYKQRFQRCKRRWKTDGSVCRPEQSEGPQLGITEHNKEKHMFQTHDTCNISQVFLSVFMKRYAAHSLCPAPPLFFLFFLSINDSITLAYSNIRRSVYMVRALGSWPVRL